MTSKNFLIMSLLGSNDDEPKALVLPVVNIAPKPTPVADGATTASTAETTGGLEPKAHVSRGSFLGNLVSQFQTSFGVPGSGGNTPSPGARDGRSPTPQASKQGQHTHQTTLNQYLQNPSESRALSVSPAPSKPRVSTPKSRPVNQHVKRFQTNFNFDSVSSPASSKTSSPIPVSKTSINSLINTDDAANARKVEPSNNNNTTTTSTAPPAPKKRKQPSSKKDGEHKKQKTESPASSGANSKTKAKQSLMSIKEMMNDSPNDGLKLSPTMTAERDGLAQEEATIPKATVVDIHSDKSAEKDKSSKNASTKEKKKEVVEMPIIVLNIPLLDPKKPQPGRSEVVVNVLKLAEDKYGWNSLHPQAKNAFEYMEDLIDDDDDGSGDDDEEVVLEAARKKEEEENLTPEQLARRHQTKMNRKVGKYDYEDPFIDDEELQMEEEITSTKEGFFVYWGPLVDDRNTNTKKGGSKSKK